MELQKRKLYQEYIDASQNKLNQDNSDYDSKKMYLQTQVGQQNDSGECESIVTLDESNYYESNGELFCVEADQALAHKNQQPKVTGIKKVHSITNFYKISYESEDVLG